MAIVTKTPSRPVPPVSGDSADAARAAALAMFEGATIDDSSVPVESGDVVKAPEPIEEKSPEEDKEPVVAAEDKPSDEKPAEEPKKDGLPDPLKNSFEKLAREKAEMRKQTDALKTREAAVAKYEMLERAVANNDALGALQMLGLKYSTLVKQQVAKGGADDEEEAEPEVRNNPYEERIAALESTLRESKMKQADSDLRGHVSAAVKVNSAKYPNVAADPELARDVVAQLIAFTKEAGRPPGDTLDESIQMALEAVENREEQAAQKYLKRKGLTGVKPPDSIPPAGTKSAVDPAASELAKKSRTLTNSHASAPRAVGSTTAETPEELRAKALALLEAQGE